MCPIVVLYSPISLTPHMRDREFSNDDGNENGKKEIGLDKQKNNFARVSRFVCISLPSLHD